MSTTVSSRSAQFYVIRVDSEWAHVCIDELTGSFMCDSSYGAFAHIWAHRGPATLKEFLADLEFDYFMGKTATERYLKFDLEASLVGIKEFIVENRRSESITKDEARAALEDLEMIHGFNDEQRFYELVSGSNALMRIYGSDLSGIARRRRDSQCDQFWKRLWPEILTAFKQAKAA